MRTRLKKLVRHRIVLLVWIFSLFFFLDHLDFFTDFNRKYAEHTRSFLKLFDLLGLDDFIRVEQPITEHVFTRSIDAGERSVLNLAYDTQAALLLIDDKKARNEAKEQGFRVVKTSTLLKRAEELHVICSYSEIMQQLQLLRIYLP